MPYARLVLTLFLLAGTLLLGRMVWRVGLHELGQSLGALGWWLVPFLLLEAVPNLLHAAGWAACFPGPRPPLRLWQISLVRLAGMGVNQVTPTATLGGEVVRALLLTAALPGERAVAPVLIGKASVTMAQMLYLSGGMLYLTQHVPLPAAWRLSLSLLLGLLTLGLMGFVACQRYGVLSKSLPYLASLPRGQALVRRLGPHLTAVDTHLRTYYRLHPWRLLWSLLWHGLAFAFDGIKTYVLLHLLLKGAAPGLAQAFVIAVAVAALDQLFFFVPGRVGTLEGGRFAILSMLGVAPVAGLAFGLVARVEQLVWSGLGLGAYALCTRFPALLRPLPGREHRLRHNPSSR